MKRARRYWRVVAWLGPIAMLLAGGLLWMAGYVQREAKEAAPFFHQNYDATAEHEEIWPDDWWAWRFRGRAGLGELRALAQDPTLSPRGRRIALEIHDYILGGEHLESMRGNLADVDVQTLFKHPVEAAYHYYLLVHDSLYPPTRVPLVRYRLLDFGHLHSLINVTPGEMVFQKPSEPFVHSEITSTRLANGEVQFTIMAPFNSVPPDSTDHFDTGLGVIRITYQADGEVATESSDGLRDLPSEQDGVAIRCTFTVTEKELREPDLVFRMMMGDGQPGGSVATYYFRLGKFLPKSPAADLTGH